MICQVYKRRDGDWSFRFVFNNGAKAGHRYRDATDAGRGAADLIAALRSEGDGVIFQVLDETHADHDDDQPTDSSGGLTP